jgi:hypothetical protein
MNEPAERGPLFSGKELPASGCKFNRFIPLFLALMLILSVIPMFYYPDPTFYAWINSSTVNALYWIIDSVIYIVFALIVWQKNRAEIPLRYGLMFLWVLLFTILVGFIQENTIAYTDANGGNPILCLAPVLPADLRSGGPLRFVLFFCFLISLVLQQERAAV